LGQSLRRFADHISNTVGEDHGKRVRNWLEEKKAGWSAVFADPQMPAMSTRARRAGAAPTGRGGWTTPAVVSGEKPVTLSCGD
jgi:hypothetical protein